MKHTSILQILILILLSLTNAGCAGCGEWYIRDKFEPVEKFNESATPQTRYDSDSSWAAFPNRDDPSDMIPMGIDQPPPESERPVDVFYIHPTTTFDPVWNAKIDDEAARAMTDWMLATQASAFNAVGRIYAPLYRQAGLYPMLIPSAQGYISVERAYDDIEAAFEMYLTEYNNGRPFIIAAHSQGAIQGVRLLAEHVQGTPWADKMVATYLVGGGIPLDIFEKVLTEIPPCKAPDDTGCVVGWDTMTKNGEWGTMTIGHLYSGQWVVPTVDQPRLCINPLTWKENDYGDRWLNNGTLPVPMDEIFTAFWEKEEPEIYLSDGLPFLSTQLTGAVCMEDGRLVAEEPDDNRIVARMGSFHGYDYLLYWANIRVNAELRTQSWLKK